MSDGFGGSGARGVGRVVARCGGPREPRPDPERRRVRPGSDGVSGPDHGGVNDGEIEPSPDHLKVRVKCGSSASAVVSELSSTLNVRDRCQLLTLMTVSMAADLKLVRNVYQEDGRVIAGTGEYACSI